MLEDYLQALIQEKQFNLNSPNKINSQKDQLLLSHERASFTTLSENQESISNLLVAPYDSIKFVQQKSNITEDKTILNASQTLTVNSKEDILRLKQIIDNKNHIIGQLTQQMIQMADKIFLLCKKGADQFQCFSKNKQIFKSGSRIHYQKNLQFLQNNNNQLYSQLKQRLKQNKLLKYSLKQKQFRINQLQMSLDKLKNQNQELKKINLHLKNKTKEFLNDSHNEIRIFTKMRSIIQQKLCQKDAKQPKKCSKSNIRQAIIDDNSKSISKKHKHPQIQTTLTKKINTKSKNESFISNKSLTKCNNKQKLYDLNECSTFSKSLSRL